MWTPKRAGRDWPVLRECASEGEGVNERKVQAPSGMKNHDRMRTTGDLQRPITAAFSLAVLRCYLPSGKVADEEYLRTIINDPATSVTSKYSK